MPNPYEVLGVSRTDDADTIKKAYKKLARKFHPDINKDPGAEQRFKEINSAYDVLGDEKKRANYDRFGSAEGPMPGGFPGGFSGGGFPGGGFGGAHGVDMGDILGSLFGSGFGGAAPQRGQDIQVRVQVDPLTSFIGGETTVAFQRYDGRASVRVNIPAGARHGQKLRIRGEGAPPRGGGPCGDLLAHLEIADHPLLRRDGDNLELEVPLTILEALQGTTLTVPTPTGDVRVNVKGGVKSGQRLRLRGRGVQRKGNPGDLFLVLRPQVPQTDEPAMLAAAQALEAAYGVDIRAGLRL